MKKKILLFSFCLTIILSSYSQVSKTNNTSGTVTNVPASGSHLDRTFTFTAGEFTSISLTEVELSLRLILGNGTPPTPGSYGVHEDLNVRLVSPLGTTVDLVQDRWGYWTGDSTQPHSFNGFNAVDATVNFDDDDTTNIQTLNNWQNGNYAPHDSLSAFDGEDALGTWTLRISDGNNQFAPNDYIHFVTATLTVTSGSTLSTINIENFENMVNIITTPEEIQVVYADNLSLEGYIMYDITGAEVVIGTKNSIDTSSLTSGIYILNLDFDRGTVTKKVIIN